MNLLEKTSFSLSVFLSDHSASLLSYFPSGLFFSGPSVLSLQ
jgi:hypothetical protein